MNNETRSGRRQFLRGGLWCAAMAALAAVAVALGRRAVGEPKASGQTCANDFICSRCGVYDGCTLPQALSRKQSLSRRP